MTDLNFRWNRSSEQTVVSFRAGLREALSSVQDRSVFLIIDSNVFRLWQREIGELLEPDNHRQYVFNATEENKSPEMLQNIWRSMSRAGVRRDTTVLAIGGGTTCDIGALAASTFHRGTELVLMPTTVLSMADACLGGKTAVNLNGTKNQIGTFYPADSILIAGCFINTLPPREYRNGMAEILKTAIIGDREIGTMLQAPPDRDVDHSWLLGLVRRCLKVKGRIVSGDLTETGERMLLNLGHTLGHALESVSGYDLSHGEAVGLGTIAAAHMAGQPEFAGEIRGILAVIGLPTGLSVSAEMEQQLSVFMNRDKKTVAEGRTWVLPFGWEDCRLTHLSVTGERGLVGKALEFLRNGEGCG